MMIVLSVFREVPVLDLECELSQKLGSGAANKSMKIKFGLATPSRLWTLDWEGRQQTLSDIVELGFDHVFMADHVSFGMVLVPMDLLRWLAFSAQSENRCNDQYLFVTPTTPASSCQAAS